MRVLGATLRRELGAYFVSPMAYGVLTFFLFLLGVVFWQTTSFFADAEQPYTWEQVFGWLFFLMVVIVPFITMRLLAEEKNRGTIEMLVTAPVREWVIVVSKFLAAVAFWCFLLLWTLAYAALLSRYATVDWGQLAAGYLGIVLAGMSMCAIGLFISGAVSNQVTAGVVTFVVGMGMALGAQVGAFVETVIPGEGFARLLRRVLTELDWFVHITPFTQGIVDLRHVAFFAAVIVFFLFVTILGLESRRWR